MRPVLAETGFTWDGIPIGDDERVRWVLQRMDDELEIVVQAPYHGDPPPPGEPGPTDALWEHEVVEVFLTGLAPAGRPVPYLEIELSPHGHHLVLDLHGVRNPVRTGLDIDYQATITGDRWRGEARIPWRYLPARLNRFNCYAIHGAGAARRYLAMAPVPGPQPDFHRLELFASWPG